MALDVSKQLERAKRYLEKNKVEDAIEAYLAVLEAVPTHQEAMQTLGDLYMRLDKLERAAAYYGLLFDRLTDPREEPKAIALYTRFLRGATQPPERVARYALLLQKQNKTQEAIEQYSAAADLFLARGRSGEALACLGRIAQLDPDNAARHVALGELAEQQGKPAAAARGFLRAGQLAAAAAELDRALELFARAYALMPSERGVALLYAQARLRQGDAPAAVALLEPLAGAESDPVFLETFGDALVRTGQLERARAVLEHFYHEKPDRADKLFDLADRFAKAKEDEQAVQVLTLVKKRMCEAHRENEFAVQLDRLAAANSSCVRLIEFWGALYSELNRESKYFDVLVRLFDVYLETGNLRGACDVLERLVDIDPYDYRNQERIQQLEGRADPAYLRGVAGRLIRAGSQLAHTPSVPHAPGEAVGDSTSEQGHEQQVLDDLLVQAEIFLQYSLQTKAVELLQRIAQMSPGEEERNERLRNLYLRAHWFPAGSEPKPKQASAADAESSAGATTRTGSYSPETLRDLSKISEINQTVYRQPAPRAMLNVAASEIGNHLHATRCLALVGAPGQPPQMAAEYCAPGVEPSSGPVIMGLLAQLERAVPDSLGGLPLDAAAAPVLHEMALEAALGVALTDKETQAPAGMLVVGFAAPHKWTPNETYFLQSVGDQMLLSVKHTRLRSLVRTLAVADEKTGLLARSSYTDCLLAETKRAKEQGTPLAIAILQMDHGPELLHQEGEKQVEQHMEQLARTLQPVVRQSDLAVKYTTWSLAFILPDMTLAGARNLVDRLRKAAGGVPPPWEARAFTLSASIAQAVTRADYDSEDIVTDLINRAEAGLEEARRRGGDTIVSLDLSPA